MAAAVAIGLLIVVWWSYQQTVAAVQKAFVLDDPIMVYVVSAIIQFGPSAMWWAGHRNAREGDTRSASIWNIAAWVCTGIDALSNVAAYIEFNLRGDPMNVFNGSIGVVLLKISLFLAVLFFVPMAEEAAAEMAGVAAEAFNLSGLADTIRNASPIERDPKNGKKPGGGGGPPGGFPQKLQPSNKFPPKPGGPKLPFPGTKPNSFPQPKPFKFDEDDLGG